MFRPTHLDFCKGMMSRGLSVDKKNKIHLEMTKPVSEISITPKISQLASIYLLQFKNLLNHCQKGVQMLFSKERELLTLKIQIPSLRKLYKTKDQYIR